MKKILALILCITLLCAIIVGCDDKGNGDEKSTTTPRITTTKASTEATTAPCEDIVGNPASDFEYQETEIGDIKITRYIGKSENVVVPRLINGKKVTELAFKNFQDNIATIYIPDTVVTIAGSCFRNAVRLEKVDFSEGLTVFSGETGAGKSILLDCLGLLLGKRAETSLIRRGAEKFLVSGTFEINDKNKLRNS